MYLYKKTYVKNWEHTSKERRHKVTVKLNGVLRKDINPEKVAYITEDVAYWRKANMIHNWFIQNCAGGDGNKTTMEVSKSELESLLADVNKVLTSTKLIDGKIQNGSTGGKDENGNFIWIPCMEDGKLLEDSKVAQEILPTSSGFFFGSTDYNEYYWQDLLDTKETLEEVLANTSNDQEFEYYASW